MKKINFPQSDAHSLLKKNGQFASILLKWNRLHNKRMMPWKGETDPYIIWLSEIILQQTRVDQGLAYFNRFVVAYPTIRQLASAPETAVFKLWEGLGYYSRCKNMVHTARYIANELNGVFPDQYEDIIKLKGIGPYTAAAISSFAFKQPHAVIDGNVFRVLARVFGITLPLDSLKGKAYFKELASKLLHAKKPGLYNQAIMDLGAIICKPAQPLCNSCPFEKYCFAFQTVQQANLPVKQNRVRVKKRHFTYMVINCDGKLALKLRIEKDIWQNLYEFIQVEAEAPAIKRQLVQFISEQTGIEKKDFQVVKRSELFTQKLTHQHISSRFIEIVAVPGVQLPANYTWVARAEIGNYPFPGIINQYLKSF